MGSQRPLPHRHPGELTLSPPKPVKRHRNKAREPNHGPSKFPPASCPDNRRSSSAGTRAALTLTDVRRIGQFLDGSASENTRASYRSAWKAFTQWAGSRAALAMPASPALSAAYLSHPAEERHLSVATVRLHRAAVAAIHKTNGHADPTDNEGVRRVLKGIARTHGRATNQAKPLTAEALAAVRATAPNRRPLGDGKKQESPERASWRARVDLVCYSRSSGTASCAVQRPQR